MNGFSPTPVSRGLCDLNSRADIEVLVSCFYARVRRDALLGELFERHLSGIWAEHEARVCDFWETVLLGSPKFKSRALLGHLPVDAACPLCPFHFGRWCDLFQKSVEANFAGERASRALERSRAMSEKLQSQLQKERGCPFAAR